MNTQPSSPTDLPFASKRYKISVIDSNEWRLTFTFYNSGELDKIGNPILNVVKQGKVFFIEDLVEPVPVDPQVLHEGSIDIIISHHDRNAILHVLGSRGSKLVRDVKAYPYVRIVASPLSGKSDPKIVWEEVPY